MNFTKFDMSIIIVMSLAIIAMSFTLPALGLGDTDVEQSDIPEYNTTGDEFDVVGDFPDSPGTPSTGVLFFQANVSEIEDDRRIWLNGDTQDGTELLLFDNGSNSEAKINLNQWTTGDAVTDTVVLSDPGDVDEIDNQTEDWEIVFEYEDRTLNGTSNVTMTVSYRIVQRPSDTQWYTGIPVVGAIFGAGEQLAGIVGWIGSILWWTFGTIFEVIASLVVMLYNIITYFVGMGHWLINTYSSIIATADTWAAVFVMIPFIALFLEFAKLIMIGISLLPTT